MISEPNVLCDRGQTNSLSSGICYLTSEQHGTLPAGLPSDR